MAMILDLQAQGLATIQMKHLKAVMMVDKNADGLLDASELRDAIDKMDLVHASHRLRKAKIVLLSLLVFLVLVLGGAIFSGPQPAAVAGTYSEAFYFSVITLSTVGLGDFSPSSDTGSDILPWFAFSLLGLGVYATFIASVPEMVEYVEGYLIQKMACGRCNALMSSTTPSAKKGDPTSSPKPSERQDTKATPTGMKQNGQENDDMQI